MLTSSATKIPSSYEKKEKKGWHFEILNWLVGIKDSKFVCLFAFSFQVEPIHSLLSLKFTFLSRVSLLIPTNGLLVVLLGAFISPHFRSLNTDKISLNLNLLTSLIHLSFSVYLLSMYMNAIFNFPSRPWGVMSRGAFPCQFSVFGDVNPILFPHLRLLLKASKNPFHNPGSLLWYQDTSEKRQIGNQLF